jgi:hypothetical protein
LENAGFASAFSKKQLPSWWDNEILKTPSGLQLAQMHFARAFNLDFLSLTNANVPLAFLNAERKFKLSKHIPALDVEASANFATAMAKIALQKGTDCQQTVPTDPTAFRAELLQTNDCVNLQSLLDWCKNAGIPVLHIANLPGKKMTGLVVRENNQFAIVLSKKGTPSHHLFHLAHELGHIANKHLSGNGFVADEKIGEIDGNDVDEKEADAYAIRLLNGRAVAYKSESKFHNGAALHKASSALAKRDKIDVGHIILNFANAQNAHPLAATALKLISGELDGSKLINHSFFKSINIENFPADQLELLHKATGFKATA